MSEISKNISDLEHENYDSEEMIESYFKFDNSENIYKIHKSYYKNVNMNYINRKKNIRNILELIKGIVEIDFIPKSISEIINLIKNSKDKYCYHDYYENKKLILKNKLSEYDDIYKELFNNDCILIDTYYIDCIKLREFIKNMVHIEDLEELKFEIGLNMDLLNGSDEINNYEMDEIIKSIYKNI